MIDYLNSDEIEKQPYPAGIDLFKSAMVTSERYIKFSQNQQ